MPNVTLGDVRIRLDELVRRVEAGETIVVVRGEEPVLDLVPHRPRRRIDLAAGAAYLRERGITDPILYVADDFDEPLPDDILLSDIAKNS